MKRLDPKAIWLFFSKAALVGEIILVSLVVLILLPRLDNLNFVNSVILLSLPIFTLIIIVTFVWAKLSYQYWKYELRDDEIRIEKGVVIKRYVSIPYGRIQNVDIIRGFSRMFDLSDIYIQTAGYSVNPALRAEGVIPGLSIDVAEEMRDKLMARVKKASQGL